MSAKRPTWSWLRDRVLPLGLLLAPVAPTAVRGQDSTQTTAAQRAGQARVQPGDRIFVRIPREKELTDSVMVDPQGNIALAKVGVIRAGDIAIAALEDTVRARYAVFLRNPGVSITVLRRVVVNGEVKRPDVYFVDLSSTLRDVIAIAGGITEIGDPGKVTIIRNGVSLPAPHWQNDVTRAADLHSGDEVVVGMRPWLERNAFTLASTGVLIASFLITVLRK